jgi:hypothetical protein
MTRVIALPVSGRHVLVRALTGAEELLLLEAADDDLALALRLMTHLARPMEAESAGGSPDAWLHLTPTDVDFFILRLRQFVLGDRIVSDVHCQASGCSARIDVSFSIDQYIAHLLPARADVRGRGWIAESADEPGWYRVKDSRRRPASRSSAAGAVFRLPTAADLRDVATRRDASAELTRRCIRSEPDSARQRRMAESAMEVIAPNLSQDLQGQCPECAAKIEIHFDPRRYCLKELRDRARFVYQDVDVIARRYHWSESDILALPLMRRTRYADAARLDGVSPS